MKPSFLFNYFKHVPEDLVISSTPGVVISVLGTLLMASLFFMQLMSYMELRTKTELVVDDLLDEMLRVNFNVTLPSAPCDYLSVDVSDLAGGARHNITKDILKWRLNSHGELLGSSLAVSVVDTPGAGKERHSNHAEDEAAFDVELDDDYEPPDANLSQPLTEATFNEFLGAHELTVVNFFAPWCIWCRRLEPVYLDAASKVPSLHFHGHTRLAQVDCVANQNFCAKNLVRAYPTLRMYKDGDGSHFEAFTGARTTEALLEFVQAQMKDYQSSHPALAAAKRSARFTVHHGALTEGSDLYRAKMDVAEAQAFCGNNPSCVGFTWHGDKKAYEKEKPMVYFKGQGTTLNNDVAWTTYTKQANATVGHSASGSLYNGPEGCRVAGHLMVRKVPGTLKLLLHSEEHDHEDGLINSSHRVDEFWYGEPLTPHQRRVMLTSDRELLDGVTSHRIEGQLFLSQAAGHAYVHYLKVVTMEIMHNVYSGAARDHRTIAYKYTVHTNKFSAETGGAGTRPSIDFRYDLSPISIVVSEDPMPMYQFLTSTCAIVGGVFTVIGLLENIIHHTSKQLMKKKI
jgi:thiol-disulfide isomerase/thioredoxin